MEKFESQFETMDVTAEYMQNSIGQSAATSTPENEVTMLMQQVADEHGLDVKQQLGTTAGHALPAVSQKVEQDADMDALSARVAALNARKV
jgi:charged multivesicular body protein 1